MVRHPTGPLARWRRRLTTSCDSPAPSHQPGIRREVNVASILLPDRPGGRLERRLENQVLWYWLYAHPWRWDLGLDYELSFVGRLAEGRAVPALVSRAGGADVGAVVLDQGRCARLVAGGRPCGLIAGAPRCRAGVGPLVGVHPVAALGGIAALSRGRWRRGRLGPGGPFAVARRRWRGGVAALRAAGRRCTVPPPLAARMQAHSGRAGEGFRGAARPAAADHRARLAGQLLARRLRLLRASAGLAAGIISLDCPCRSPGQQRTADRPAPLVGAGSGECRCICQPAGFFGAGWR
mmetsp:Transcript_10163/g.26138  ORF Transcript_10163/g.26138 Transcript_10163/m.26138 type:complete len:294 (+) Transcript_10163:633-1514(+)